MPPTEPTNESPADGRPPPSLAGSKWRIAGWTAFWTALGLVVVALLLPAFQGARSGVRKPPTFQAVQQLGLAAHNFHAQHNSFPPHVGKTSISGPGNPAPSWLTALLPHVDENKLWTAYDGTKRFDDPANAAVVGTEVEAFLSPHEDWTDRRSEGGFGLSHFAGNVHVLGEDGARRISACSDGTVNTVLAGHVGGFPKPWADPLNLRDPAAGLGTAPQQFGGPYEGGTVIVMVDGSTHFLSEDVDPEVLAALGTPNGGEVIDVAF